MDVGADNFRFELDDPEKKARTIRYPKTAELHLDSLDRYVQGNIPATYGIATISDEQNFLKLIGPILASATTNATNNCRIQTKRNLIYGYMCRVALTQFNLSFKVPTIVTGYNDLCAVIATGSGLPQLITIPQGFYNLTTLAAQLQTSLRTIVALSAATVVAPTSQVTAAPLTSITTGFTVTANGGSTMQFVYGFLNASKAQQLQVARFNRLIGVNRAGAGYTPDVNLAPAPSPYNSTAVPWASATLGIPNFRYTDYVDIVSQSLTNYKDTKDANSAINSPGSVMGRIWLTEYPLSSQAVNNGYPQDGMWGMGPMTFTKTWNTPMWAQWSPNQAINTVDITLLDQFGMPLPWSSTYPTEWSCSLQVTE